MDQILDLARELGYSIQQDERFIRTQLAQAAADEDEELQGLIGEFKLNRIAYNAENNKEGKDAEKHSRLDGEIREIYSRLMMNEHMAAYNDAKTELDKLVNQIATIVTMSAQGEDPESISAEGCGGNCAGCSGCH